ncbi:hypothetical protein BDW68DRAFT_162434 [Aspergillus falconensis]
MHENEEIGQGAVCCFLRPSGDQVEDPLHHWEAFQPLDNTLAAKYLNVSEFAKHSDVRELGSGLLVTSDFARTVRVPKPPSSTIGRLPTPC